jgi:hypothetical protein
MLCSRGFSSCCCWKIGYCHFCKPSHWFWTARLMKVFGHEGACTYRYNNHGWILYIILFPLVCGMLCGSSWLRRNEFLKMTK